MCVLGIGTCLDLLQCLARGVRLGQSGISVFFGDIQAFSRSIYGAAQDGSVVLLVVGGGDGVEILRLRGVRSHFLAILAIPVLLEGSGRAPLACSSYWKSYSDKRRIA